MSTNKAQQRPSNASSLNNTGQGVTAGPRARNTPSTAARGIGRVAPRGRGGFAGGPGLFDVSPQGEILHEGIPQSKELMHLAELKEVASEHARNETVGTTTGIPKGGAASLAQSAFGKYATAISEETGIPSLSIQGMVPPAKDVDEEKLVQELKEEAQERVTYEATHMGRVPQAGPARKVEESAERLEHVVKMDRGEEQPPVPISTGAQATYTTPPVSPTQKTNLTGVDQDTAKRHLSELKEVTSEHARSEACSGNIPLGSATSIIREHNCIIIFAYYMQIFNRSSSIESATGKYATAISEETGEPVSVIQSTVPRADYHVDEAKLTQELNEEARIRAEHEKEELGFVPATSPAVEEATVKLNQGLKISEGQET
ncbi:9986_t:CDS:2 [Acaulospora morrowiae]|uniref:9986_t:CDS:1 n=1 Tax=Acaulospora morrowiae TaxID=94023 RepID=A0A9N9AMM1_9GLOM|nr:9986_t:CDS:2 [Acaulospora morrowiae]